MKINKLVLKNFRSYEDKTIFDFTTTDKKNMILIGGKNGAGKSTIFESIKLCIYGPLAYEYQGFNPLYISKIKSNINNNSLKNNVVDAFISVDLEINEGTEKNTYTIYRVWSFKDKKLKETFNVYKNSSEEPLIEDELNYFENYITSIISPKIFDFFFFDGEHLSNFFIGKNSNTHLKQSFLSLCNFDTFEILKNTVLNLIKVNKNKYSDIENAKEKYLSFEEKLNILNTKLNKLENDYLDISTNLDNLYQQKEYTEKSLRKKGGILAEEREYLNHKYIKMESRRTLINQNIKDFCNEMLPFLIVKNQVLNLKNQLKTENEGLVFSYIKNKLDANYIKNILTNKIDNLNLDQIASIISTSLIDDIKPKSYDDNFKIIHNLSNNENNFVLSLAQNVLDFKSNTILDLFEEHREISENLSNIRVKLNNALEDEVLNNYIKELHNVSNNIDYFSDLKSNLNTSLKLLKEEIETTKALKDKFKSYYISLIQSHNVVDISNNIVLMIDDIIYNLIKSKIEEIKHNFMYIFNKVIQKNNFIDFIDIDSDFNVSLYINKVYNSFEIENLIENIGFDEIEKKFGELFLCDLFKIYDAKNKDNLINIVS